MQALRPGWPAANYTRTCAAHSPRRESNRPSPGALTLRALLTTAGLLLAIAVPDAALASCKTQLPTPALRSLDASVDSDPALAIRDARARLRPGSSARDALWNGQLQAVIADAYDTLSDDLQARTAVLAGRDSLKAAANTPDAQGVLLRLELVLADTAQGPRELAHSVEALGTWEPQIGPQSLAHACLLLVRSRVEGRLYQYEDAARDGLLAHRIALENGSGDARAETGYQLVTTFRRAGLYDDALRMADDVITYTGQQGQQAMLAMALTAKGQTLGALHRHELASPILDLSRTLSLNLHDAVGVAFVDLERCRQLIDQNRIADGEPVCKAAIRGFLEAGRQDQAIASTLQLARIDLAKGQALSAATQLRRLLHNEGHDVPPTYLPALYRTFAEALGQIGRPAEAFNALQKSVQLAELADERQRSLAVAVLNAREQAEVQERERRGLESEVAAQRALAGSRKLAQRLATGLAVAGVLLSTLLLWLLVTTRRHSRALRRQEMILRETSDNAPDALALLDVQGRTRFANRGLFGERDPPALDQPLADSVPASTRAAVAAAVVDLVGKRRPTSVDVTLTTADVTRHFELRGVPILENGQLLGATLRASDVTELRDLEREVLDIASLERHRLSSDLHEGLGQELTGIALLLRGAANAASQGRADVQATLAECIAHVGEAITATRDLARGLSPVHIEHGSLSAALTRLAVDAERRLHVTVASASQPKDIQTSDTVSDHVYRIAQEAVTNAARHGACNRIDIDLTEDPHALRLVIADDGRGVETPPGQNEGLGMRMMGYRARQLGGRLQVESGPSAGTRVTLTVPRSALNDA